jgi:hypothetical protein
MLRIIQGQFGPSGEDKFSCPCLETNHGSPIYSLLPSQYIEWDVLSRPICKTRSRSSGQVFPRLYETWNFITTTTITCDWNLPWIYGNHFLNLSISFTCIVTLFCQPCLILPDFLFSSIFPATHITVLGKLNPLSNSRLFPLYLLTFSVHPLFSQISLPQPSAWFLSNLDLNRVHFGFLGVVSKGNLQDVNLLGSKFLSVCLRIENREIHSGMS